MNSFPTYQSHSPSQPCTSLLWLHSLSPLFRPLSKNILREINLYLLLPGLLVAVYDQWLVLYHVNTDDWVRLPRPVDLPRRGFFCFVDVNCVFGFAGDLPRKEVVAFDVKSYETRRERGMNAARRLPSAVGYGKTVYVFGGWGPEPLEGCERKRVDRAEDWTDLPNLPVLGQIHSSTVAGGTIYLSPVFSQGAIIAFTPSSDTFRLLPLQSEGNCGVSFTLGSSLWLPSYNHSLELLSLTSQAETRTLEVTFAQEEVWQMAACSCAPTLYGQEVIWLNRGAEERLYRFNTNSMLVTTQPIKKSRL